MKSQSTVKLILGSAISMIAFSASNGPALPESLEVQCRSAVRADLKGPDCRMYMPPNTETHPCNMSTHGQIAYYDSLVVKCVAQGGPERKSAGNAR
jgi:hypothetical protein